MNTPIFISDDDFKRLCDEAQFETGGLYSEINYDFAEEVVRSVMIAIGRELVLVREDEDE